MASQGLADFLEELQREGELARIGAEVDPQLEIAEITRRVSQMGGPALLFERVRGQSTAVVTNLLGTSGRVCRALGVEHLSELAERTQSLVAEHTPQNWFDRLKMTGGETGADKFKPKSVKAAPCQQVVRLGRDVDLLQLPLLKQWPHESFAGLAGARLVTQASEPNCRTAAICSVQAVDASRLALVDEQAGGFAGLWARAQAAGEKLPVAIVLGGDPATMAIANLDIDAGLEAFHLAGLLRGRPLELVKCRTLELEVPADADVVLEGYFDPDLPPVVVEAAVPGGSHYQLPTARPLLQVTAITQRTHAIVPQVVDAGPLGERAALTAARERLLLDSLAKIAPAVVDLALPCYGGVDRFAFVAIRKGYPFHARQVASALWGTSALRFTKFLILVDAHVNVHVTDSVLVQVGANATPERDIFNYDGPSASAGGGLARHVGIDATRKIAGEQPADAPGALRASPDVAQLVSARWAAEYGLTLKPPTVPS